MSIQSEHEPRFNLLSRAVRVRAPISMNDPDQNDITYHHVEYLFDDAMHKLKERIKEFNPELTLITEI